MKISKFLNLALLAGTALASAGCLERNFVEDVGRISVDTREIVVPSDMYDGRNLVKDTLYVTSNRNWSVKFEDDVDWVTIDTTGHLNLARISDVTPLVFSFKDNETEAERTAQVRVTCEDGSKLITLRQEAISYRLVLLSSREGLGSVSSDKTEIPLEVNCNTDWTVKVMDGATASVTFSAPGGKYTGSVNAIVAENDEMITKDATIVISAKNCKDIEIPITQLKGIPYFRFTTEEGVNSIQAPTATDDYLIPIKTNTEWTAEVTSVEGYEPTTVSVVGSGTKSAETVKVTFPYTISGPVDGKIVVRFKAEGVAAPVEFTITQKPGARIRYYDYEAKTRFNSTANASIVDPPFAKPYFPNSKGDALNDMKATEVTLTLRNGLKFIAYSTAGFWQNSGTGLMFGEANGNYLKIPVIEGRKPVRMEYWWGLTRTANTANPLKLILVDPDGITVESNPAIELAPQAAGYSHGDFSFIGTEAGKQYKLQNNSAYNFGFGDLILYYE